MTDANPPRWAEAVLRALLRPRDRDTITGDLLEEYREVALPGLGVFRARLWYLRHALSLMTISGLLRAAARSFGKCSHAVFWAAIAGAVEYTFVYLVPGTFGLPLGLSLFVVAVAVLGIGGATAIRSVADVWRLWRDNLLWGVLSGVAISVIALGNVFTPMLVAAVAVTFIAAGFRGAQRTDQIRTGILGAMLTSLTGSVLTLVVTRPWTTIPLPVGVALLAISTMLGTIGAIFGKNFGQYRASHRAD